MNNIVLVGAGGTGVSGVACLLQDLGFANLICIDSTQSQLTDKLSQRGIHVIIGHGNYIPKLHDAIIYSEACAESPEVLHLRKINKEAKIIPFLLNYFQFLGEISKFFTTIGITGTNGKSSTTALTLYGAQHIPEFWLGILGALVPDFNQQSYLLNTNHKETIKDIFTKIFTGKFAENSPKGQQEAMNTVKSLLFIVEACEYKRHFLNLDLDYAIITNMEYDHADFYKDFDNYKNAFKQMLTKLKQKAFVLDWFLETFPEFTAYQSKIQEIPEQEVHFDYIFGPHTNKNASLGNALLETIHPWIKNNSTHFKWLRRRLEYITTTEKWATIFSDYGHMASSLAIWYEALRQKFPEKKLLCVFQPHQINRIHTGRDDFVKATQSYDQTIIYDIYPAREKIQDFDFSSFGTEIKTLEDLGNTFAQRCSGSYITTFDTLTETINKLTQERVIVIFTAGDLDFQIRNTYNSN